MIFEAGASGRGGGARDGTRNGSRQRGEGSGDVLLRDLEYVVVDVETTGGSVYRGDRITEVAVVRVNGRGEILEEFQSLVNPGRPIPPFITALTRITNDMVRDAPPFREIAPEVQRLLAGRVFVAHNAAFDWRFISTELEWATGVPPEGQVLCTVRLARRLVPEVSSRSLDSLSLYFGVENEARHRAMGDALATAMIFRGLLERIEEHEVESWGGLEALLSRRSPRRKRRSMPTSMD
ncbi:MAG TPA: 3'-5' exonuclease [Longimicrobiales bacterium]|nr:3'-5' exonuclease [Longimicrobiales bacterium]